MLAAVFLKFLLYSCFLFLIYLGNVDKMSKIKFLIPIYYFIIFSCFAIAQKQNNPAIATVGKDKISAEEFKKRFELTPHLNNDEFNPDSTKYDLLYSIIAEDLWAQKARDLGYDTTAEYYSLVRPLLGLYVRDALFKKEVESKIKYPADDVKKAIERSEWTLKVNILSSADSVTIYNIYDKLKNGAPFDSLLKASSDSGWQYKPIDINYGDMNDVYVEDTLYNMKVGNYSSPIKTINGWFIFDLVDKVQSLKGAYTDEGSVRESVMRALKERKAKAIGEVYIKNLMSKQRIVTDIHLFRSLVYKIIEVVQNKIKNDSYYANHYITLTDYDLAKLKSMFPADSLNMPFVKFANNPSTVKNFLDDLTIDLFVIANPKIDFINIADLLLVHVNYFIRQEALAREGIIKGLQNTPEVKSDLNIWEKSYLSKMLRNTFYDSIKVSNSEINDFFNSEFKSQNSTEEVKIQEIISDKLDVMETILNDLKKGKDFGELAKIYSIDKTTRDNNGETNYFPINMNGSIGKAAAKMKLDQVYGPIATDKGYAIIKLIGKKEKPENDHLTLNDSIKTVISNEILKNKWNQKINSYTQTLANQYGVNINDQALKALKLTDVNMFTYRFMGFGGRITAIPYLVPWYEWYYKWKQNNKTLVP